MSALFPIITQVKKLHGHLVIFIPLDKGGRELSSATRGLSDIEGPDLKIVFPGWLAQELGLEVDCDVSIDIKNNQFNIQRQTVQPSLQNT